MGKTKQETNLLKKKYAILKAKGMLQKDIAKQLGVTQATISDWAKHLPISHYFTIREGMQKRLIALTKDVNTPALDLYNLANALAAIDKTIERYTKGLCVSKTYQSKF